MEKETIREQARLHRARMNVDPADAEHIVAEFNRHVPTNTATNVAAYWPVGKELDVRFLIADLISRDIPCLLPIVRADAKIMAFSKWDGKSNLVKGAHGTWVPAKEELADPDILVMPLLAFDRRGVRLGQGGGYYDATLELLRKRKTVLAIGAAYASQAVLFNLPVEEHDQKMDMVLTPSGIQDFRK